MNVQAFSLHYHLQELLSIIMTMMQSKHYTSTYCTQLDDIAKD